MKISFVYFFFILLAFSNVLQAQDRIVTIRKSLDSISSVMPGLMQPVDLTVESVALDDFIRGLAISNNVNIAINTVPEISIENNFSGVKVIDVFVFLCDNYQLDIKLIGNIIVFSKYVAPTVAEKPKPQKTPTIEWNDRDSLLTYDLNNDTLMSVTKKITDLTGTNIILSPDIRTKLVNGYIKNVKLAEAVEKLAFMNGLVVSEDGKKAIQLIDKKEITNSDSQKSGGKTNNKSNVEKSDIEIANLNKNAFDINAENVAISEIITVASRFSGEPVIQLTEVKDKISLSVTNITFKELLDVILSSTSAVYKHSDSLYIVGEKSNSQLKSCRVIQFQHRSVIDLSKVIPEVFRQNLTVTEFPELNSLIVCGSEQSLENFSEFARSIDKNVPQVLIEVIIIDQQTSHTVSTGIKAGIGTVPTTTSGELFPSVNMTLGADAVNNLINSINGFGTINLGRVTQNFYLSLSAMESNGQINIRSTPRLSTLNGVESTLSIGTTEYYLEESNNIIGSQNPQTIVTQQYRSVEANFLMKILPIVHGDDQITLKITVEQSDFTGRISPNAPPGKVSRTFVSSIRIKNQEMILLGGLEEKSTSESGDGSPVLSRIPILKWLSSSRTREKSKKRLSVFIRPTIIY